MITTKPILLIAGFGPGLGLSCANVFADSGYQIIGLVREYSEEAYTDEITTHAVNLTDAAAVQEFMETVVADHGVPDVVIYNPAALVIKPFLEHTTDDFRDAWDTMVLGAVNVAQAIIPVWQGSGDGTLIATGATASVRGGKNFAAFASAKFALRGLIQSLAREFQSEGIHVVHTIIDGIIDTPRSRILHEMSADQMIAPTAIAQIYLDLTNQHPSSWTHEIDIRPSSESF